MIKDPILINVSLPKTSSSSLADYCNQYCFATHEAWHSDMTNAIIKNHLGEYPDESLRNFYIFRNTYYQHDVDSSTFNHFIMEDIFNIFPNSSYIYIYRDCCSWVASMLNMWHSFNVLHKKRMKDTDKQVSQSSSEWLDWINKYSTLYSPNLSDDFWDLSNFDIQSVYFRKLVSDLTEFWIQLGNRVLKAKKTNYKLHVFPLSQSSEIPVFLNSLFSADIDFQSMYYPTSNKSSIKKTNNRYLTDALISSVTPSQLLKDSCAIYVKLSGLFGQQRT